MTSRFLLLLLLLPWPSPLLFISFSVNLSLVVVDFLVAAVRHSFVIFEQLHLFHVLTFVSRASST